VTVCCKYISISFALILSVCTICTTATAQNTALDFFVGNWALKVWSGNDTVQKPDITAQWKLEKGLDSVLCLLGNVKIKGSDYTREFITQSPNIKTQYIRTIITNDGSTIKLTSSGWQDKLLTWTGTQVQGEKTIQLKEEIHRLSNKCFIAAFFILNNGKWVQTQTELVEKI
jgi:hypothetical protein